MPEKRKFRGFKGFVPFSGKRERGIESGRWVRVTSRHGSLVIKVLVTGRVIGKEVYLPLFSREGPVNNPDRVACGP